MYNRRVKIFVIFSSLLLAVCVLRLAQMQLLSASSVQHEIAELKQQRAQSKQLQTLRGKILDRKGRELATDEARFWVYINYELSSFLDERVLMSMRAEAAARRDSDVAVAKLDEEIREKLKDLQLIIEKCSKFKGVEPSVIWDEIVKINDHREILASAIPCRGECRLDAQCNESVVFIRKFDGYLCNFLKL